MSTRIMRIVMNFHGYVSFIHGGNTRREEPIASPIFLHEYLDDILFHNVLELSLWSWRRTQIRQSRKRT